MYIFHFTICTPLHFTNVSLPIGAFLQHFQPGSILYFAFLGRGKRQENGGAKEKVDISKRLSAFGVIKRSW